MQTARAVRLRLASLLVLSLSVPSFAATRVQLVDKAERGRDIGGAAGERIVTRPGTRLLHVRTVETDAHAHADAMTRTILRGNTPAAAIFPRGRARLELVQPTVSHDGPAIYRVTGARRDGLVSVRLLLPVSGHVDGAHPPGQEVYVELARDGRHMPIFWPASRAEVAAQAAHHGAGRFKAQAITSVSAPFDATEALMHAIEFAGDTRFRIAVDGAPRRVVPATGLVTPVDLTLHLARGQSLVTMAPEGSRGVGAFAAGRSVILER